MQCDVIVYNITEHTDLIDEATWAISGNNSSDFQIVYVGCISKHGEAHSDDQNSASICSSLGFRIQP